MELRHHQRPQAAFVAKMMFWKEVMSLSLCKALKKKNAAPCYSGRGGALYTDNTADAGYSASPSMAQRHHQPANQVPDVAEMLLWEREVMAITLLIACMKRYFQMEVLLLIGPAASHCQECRQDFFRKKSWQANSRSYRSPY
ncbi:MAG: hypothetical protein Q3990_06585 [Desulfovibrionaceae bacterium]|nr:hypothetical protein [Desulfovibrionaceae bacterium]